MWATIAIIFVSLLVGYIISNQKEEKTLSETWREKYKNAEDRVMAIPSGEHFQKELCEFLERSGYLAQPVEENVVAFLRENEKYLIRYFPEEGYIQLLKAYEWTDSEREEIASNAAAAAMQNIRCCKVIVDGDTLLFSIDTYIRTLHDFTTFISTYLEIMDAAEQCFDTRMEELSFKNKQLENQARQCKLC